MDVVLVSIEKCGRNFFFFFFILNVGTVGIESMLVSLPRNGISGVLEEEEESVDKMNFLIIFEINSSQF